MSGDQLLLRNNGGTGFTNCTSCGFSSSQYIMSALWADFDNDLDLDLVLVQGKHVNNTTTSKFMENLGNGTLSWHAPASPACFSAFNKQNNYACATDVNNDGSLDVVFRSQSSRGFSITGSNGPVSEVSVVTSTSNLPIPWDLGILDYDLDGWQDFAVSEHSNGHTSKVFRNTGSMASPPNFEDAFHFNLTPHARGLCIADFSRNGYRETFLCQGQSGSTSPSYYFWAVNSSTYPPANWIGIELVSPGHTNNYRVLGATVIESHWDHIQAQLVDGGSGRSSQQDLGLEFGLGDYSGMVDFTVNLPSGNSVQILDLEPNTFHTLSVDDPLIDESTVSVDVFVDPTTTLERYTFSWITDYWSEASLDEVTFFVGAEYPGGCLPNGAASIVGSGEVARLPSGKYSHKISIVDVECSAGCKYYYRVTSKVGSYFAVPSTLRSFKRLFCIGS